MRWLALVIGLACTALASPASAKPKVGIAPISGDRDGRIAEAIGDALGDRAVVVDPDKVERAMDQLGLDGELDQQQFRELQGKLRVRAIVQGRVADDGTSRTLRLRVTMRGGKAPVATIRFKNPRSNKFRTQVRDSVLGPLEDAARDDGDEPRTRGRGGDGGDEPSVRGRSSGDDDRPVTRGRSGRDGEDDDEPAARKRSDRDGSPRRRRRTLDADDDEVAEAGGRRSGGRRATRAALADEDDDPDLDDDRGGRERTRARPAIASALRVDAGASVGVRRLSYEGSGAMQPPRVGTGAGGGRIEAEAYPFALSDTRGALANLGLALGYDRTFGLAIDVPGSADRAPIDQAWFSLGARYRLALGSRATLAVGVGYARRKYVADRSGLAAPTDLDMPDVDYSAIAATGTLRVATTRSTAAFLDVAPMRVLATGAIQDDASYGPASVLGFAARGGLDVRLSGRLAARFTGELNQISLSFSGSGAMASARGVSGATDRTIGIAATLAVSY